MEQDHGGLSSSEHRVSQTDAKYTLTFAAAIASIQGKTDTDAVAILLTAFTMGYLELSLGTVIEQLTPEQQRSLVTDVSLAAGFHAAQALDQHPLIDTIKELMLTGPPSSPTPAV